MSSEADKCVYLHKLWNGKVFYIGMGSNSRPFNKNCRNKEWWKIVNEHKDYIVVLLATELTLKEAAIFEMQCIEKFGLENLTNRSKGGEHSAYGMKHTEEAKRKISLNNASKRPEIREKHRRNSLGEKNKMFGKSHSLLAREKIRKARTGTEASKETKLKMSAKTLGENNPAHKKQIFTFFHEQHGKIKLTQYNFRILFNVPSGYVSTIVLNRKRSLKGWRVINDN